MVHPHPQPKAVPSACLNHAWARKGKEMKNGGGGGGGGGGGEFQR